jgi:hypothetical protein
MKCKVLIRHHSYPLRRDLEVGEIVDLPENTIKANGSFYVVTTEEAPVAPVKINRELLEKTAIKRKLVRPEEAAGLSSEQLTKLLFDNKPASREELVVKAKALGAKDSLIEEMTDDQIQAFINGAK